MVKKTLLRTINIKYSCSYSSKYILLAPVVGNTCLEDVSPKKSFQNTTSEHLDKTAYYTYDIIRTLRTQINSYLVHRQ